jgi:predicted MFS family arabinose efflux permease
MVTSHNNTTNNQSTGLLPALAFGVIACLLYGVGAGLRGDIGILLEPLATHTKTSYQEVSFCIAVMNLIFGAAQPVFGLLAAKKTNRFVLILGAIVLCVSLIGMSFSTSFITLFISLGVLFGVGAGALAFGLILSSAIRRVGPERAMMISGMLNAAAGLGAFILSPTLQALTAAGGAQYALQWMLLPAVALIPIAIVVTSADPKHISSGNKTAEAAQPTSSGLFKRAFHNKIFVMLAIGFSTCGFHMVIIESHLFSQYLSYGIEASSASWAFSLYGIATIAGALISGWLSAKISKGKLLVFYYGFRAVWVLLYIFVVPKTLVTAILFSVGLGFTGDATVSPTAGLVNKHFSLTEAATLIGLLFFFHQIGAFASAWLGGILLDLTGGYVALWVLDALLCVIAAMASTRIQNK